MGKFPHSSLKAHYIFPIHGLAVVVKKNFPTRGFVPFVTHGEFYFPLLLSSLVVGKNPIPISPQ